jgi:osmotically-inducible protein OsmY
MDDRLHRGLLALALGCALVGASAVAAWTADDEGTASERAGAAAAADVDADNTGRNVRDRQETVTPMDQGNDAGDLAITQHIRKSVVNNDNLSTNAQNVKIITVDGVVTLRGPVESTEEKAFIVAAAKSAPQVKRVDDQLEVETDAEAAD